MQYVKIANGQIDQYPYTVGKLRRDNPNTSFPKSLTAEALSSWGVYPVAKVSAPAYNAATQKVQVVDPTLLEGVWTQTWQVVDKTAAEIQEDTDTQAKSMRADRDALLAETDWLTMRSSDTSTPMPAAWHTYRQALRDITSHANWPYLDEADWPTKP